MPDNNGCLKPGEPTDNVPHRTGGFFDPEPATELAPGVILLTKDGREIGNAITVKMGNINAPHIREYLQKTGQKIWIIETDFGNQTALTDNEIHSWFHLGRQSDYNNWYADHLECMKRSQEHPK